MKVTIVGAGWHGSEVAYPDRRGGDTPTRSSWSTSSRASRKGSALDMMHGRALDGFTTRIIGTNRYAETVDSSVCVIAAGERRSAGMSRHDLLEANAKVVADVTARLVKQLARLVLIVATNPLDEMLALCQAVVRRAAPTGDRRGGRA